MKWDYAEAVKWYREAAEQGLVEAQYSLGECYSKGNGVEQDYADAVKWYRKAAEHGYAAAQYYLGECYADGKGVEHNIAEAVKWCRKAVEQRYMINGAKFKILEDIFKLQQKADAMIMDEV